MATDWSTPSLSQLWANFLAAIKGRDESAAKMDFTGDTNLPSGVIRYNRTSSRFEEWNGTAWVALTPDLTSTTGALPAGQFNDTAHGNRSGGALHSAASGGAAGFLAAADKNKLDGATNSATANTLMLRDVNGRSTVATPAAADDIARKDTVDNHSASTTGVHGVGASTVESVSGAQAKVDTHAALTAAGTHGATAAASANSIMFRDVNGRSKVAAPAVSDDIARKLEVDAVQTASNTVQTNLTNHANTTAVGIHGSTAAAGANLLMHRDAAGRAQVASPAVAADIATKSYVDAHNPTPPANSVGTGQLKTATGSASALQTDSLDVTMHDYSFAPSVTATVAAGIRPPMVTQLMADPGNTVGRFHLIGATGYTQSGAITVRWRYMTASDDPTIWVIPDADGSIRCSWVSDDPVSTHEDQYIEDPATGLMVLQRVKRLLPDPPIGMPGFTAIQVPLAHLAQTGIPQRMLDSADRHIEREKLDPAKRWYRALQFHTKDAAPAAWLREQCCWKADEFRLMTPQERTAAIAKRTIPITRMP